MTILTIVPCAVVVAFLPRPLFLKPGTFDEIQGPFNTLSMSSSSSSTSSKNQVLYEKIVRPPKDGSPSFFLGQLVEYLQDHFEIPSNLPMVYTPIQLSSSNEKSVVAWDSPISTSREETQLDVEVLGIYKGKEDRFPSLAMVVVSKHSCQTTSSSVPMMQSLFADSEKKIVKALDRGLEDFEAGRIKFSSSTEEPQKRISTLEECIEAELIMEDSPEPVAKIQEMVIDTTAIEDEPAPSQIPSKMATSSFGQDDYAVQAARNAAKKRSIKEEQTRINATENIDGDFAVEAAKRIVAAQKFAKGTSETPAVQESTKIKGETKSKTKIPITNPTNDVPAGSTPQDTNSRRFSQVISTPDAYVQKAKKQKMTAEKTLEKTSNKPTEISSDNETPISRATADGKPPTQRKLNLKVMTENNINEEIQMDDELPSKNSNELQENEKLSTAKLPSKKGLELEIAETARQVMDEIAAEADDMSAEEMLRNVMQFGEEKEKEEAVGTGFATGAFEKAKTILQEQKRQREERLRFKELSNSGDIGIKLDITDPDEKSIEDELKDLFEAGERLADQRIQLKAEREVELTRSENERVDELIASERTVSGYARSLDDELTELEVRINKSPGEEFDGPRKNPLFDVMSGPEVYSPNVDPETAVNWPGALPGTKNVRLPKELDEALKQAKFAADVMLKMREDESVDEIGRKSIRYFVSSRELSHEQVKNLRKVVDEGVKIGIIDDPLEYLAERSRLQMILDELWNQPDERFKEIAENYKDLLLSENFVNLIKERLTQMADRDMEARSRGTTAMLEDDHRREREILGQLVTFTQLLVKETKALGAELEAQQLELVRSICKVAMDPSHVTEEDTAIALSDVVRDLRPMFDDVFVAYLKYAVAEEKGRLARAGLLDDPDHNQWLFVLQIVQQGVYNEISKGISRYVDHIWYVLRMNTRAQRRILLEKFVDNLPTMDVRPFVQVVDNIASSLGDAVRGDFDPADIGEMTNKLLQLRLDVHDILPPERIDIMARDADEWAARQKEKMMEARNQTQKRLKAGRDIENNPNLESEIRRRGEVERFD